MILPAVACFLHPLSLFISLAFCISSEISDNALDVLFVMQIEQKSFVFQFRA